MAVNTTPTSGIDAIERVLRRAKREGMKGFGHNYKRSIEEHTLLEEDAPNV